MPDVLFSLVEKILQFWAQELQMAYIVVLGHI